MKHLLSGLDTVECAYYLRPGPGLQRRLRSVASTEGSDAAIRQAQGSDNRGGAAARSKPGADTGGQDQPVLAGKAGPGVVVLPDCLQFLQSNVAHGAAPCLD